jgi:hypothetical protein
MSLLFPATPDDAWDHLSLPVRGQEHDGRFRVLLSALDLGWHIEEPVYLRPRWSTSGPRVYHFILRRGGQAAPRLVSVLEGAAVQQFVADEGLRLLVG